MDNKRLLIVASDSIPGGATKSLINLIDGLRTLGWEIMLTTPRNGYLCDELSKRNIKYRIFPYYFATLYPITSFKDIIKRPLSILRMLFFNSRAKRSLRALCEEFKPNIIHTNVSVVDIGFKVAQSLNNPHVWHIREYGDRDFGLTRLPSQSVFVDNISNQSYSIAITKDLYDYFNLNKNRASVIYNGIFSRTFSIPKFEKERFLLYVGRVEKGKGAEDLINSYLKYRSQGGKLPLKIAGSYQLTYFNKILALIENSIYKKDIEFLGQCNDIIPLMVKCLALIVPSFYEGFGRITAEAMFCKALVVGRNTGGTKEQFDNGLLYAGKEIGLRFKNDNELVKCLNKVENLSTEEIEVICQRGFETVCEFYSIEKNVEETNKFFMSVLESSKLK